MRERIAKTQDKKSMKPEKKREKGASNHFYIENRGCMDVMDFSFPILMSTLFLFRGAVTKKGMGKT